MTGVEFQAIRHPTTDDNFNTFISELDDFPVRELVFRPGKSLIDQLRLDRTGRVKGVVIGSGGGGLRLEVNDLFRGRPVYEEEMRMAIDPRVSYFGVCLGMQIGVAGFSRYLDGQSGPYVTPLPEPVEGLKTIQLFEAGSVRAVEQYGSHDFRVVQRPRHLQILGMSEGEVIEVVSSPDYSFYGQQFHAERGGTHSLAAYATRFATFDQFLRRGV
jgi:GMP synthase-like glutamine amidotransferase